MTDNTELRTEIADIMYRVAVDYAQGNRAIFFHDEANRIIDLFSKTLATKTKEASATAYEDCGSKGGNGIVVRGYAKTRAWELRNSLKPPTGEK